MKKLKWITAVLAMEAVLFCGCATDDDDDTPPTNSVDIPKYSGGKIP